MVVYSLGFEVLGVAAMADFCEPEAADVFGGEAIVDELFVEFAVGSMKVDDGLGVEEEGDVGPDADCRVEAIGGMCGKIKLIGILFEI